MGFTLIIGREDDLCCRLVRDRLEYLGRRVLFLPENQLFPGMDFHWELRNGNFRGAVGHDKSTEGPPVLFDQITAVCSRFSGIATSPEEHYTKDGQYLNAEWHALARGYVHSLPCTVVNRFRPELWYKMRLTVPDMMALIPDMPFHMPATMVTTRPSDAEEFFAECPHGMSYSPLSMPSDYRIHTREALQKLEPLSAYLPLCLTETVPGERVTAYLVGQDVIFDLPLGNGHATRFCREVAATLGLSFCEFELLKTPDDEWYCFGIHCMPHLFTCRPETRTAVIEQLVSLLGASAQRRAA